MENGIYGNSCIFVILLALFLFWYSVHCSFSYLLLFLLFASLIYSLKLMLTPIHVDYSLDLTLHLFSKKYFGLVFYVQYIFVFNGWHDWLDCLIETHLIFLFLLLLFSVNIQSLNAKGPCNSMVCDLITSCFTFVLTKYTIM